jgi:CO/xanthine dehydrogenase Mo-binding subunit
MKLDAELPVISRGFPRVDVIDKLTGRTRFCSDVLPPGCLHMAALHPPIARGRVIKMNIEPAQAAPGVRAVLVADDIPGLRRMGMIVDDQPVLASGEFYCASDALAIIAADTPEQARRALRRIVLEVEQLPGVFDPRAALAPDAPAATDSSERGADNIQAHYRVRIGDAAGALAGAAVQAETEIVTHHIDHAFLEPEASLAYVDLDGTIVIRGSMQAPFLTRRKVAGVLGVPVSKVRVQVPPVGGGFGGKEESGLKLGVWTAMLALRTGKPVCFQRNRSESMRGNGKREPMIVRHRLGADATGKLLGLEAEILMDKGAYASLGGSPKFVSGMLKKATMHAPGPYRLNNVHIDGYSVFTSNVPTCPMRGLGTPQVHFAMETQIDALAARLGLDPIDMRLRNCLRNGDTTFSGQVLDSSVGIAECLERVRDLAQWNTRPRSSGEGRLRRGRGVACGWYATGTASNRDAAGAVIYLAEDGTVSIGVNIVEMGQGSGTVFTLIAAEAMGLSPDKVHLLPIDTDVAPNAGITAGSRSTTVPGKALLNAATELKQRMATIAAEVLGVEASALKVENGLFFAGDRSNRSVSYAELVQLAVPRGIALHAQGWEASPLSHTDMESGRGEPFAVFAYGAQIVDVEVDTATGQCRALEAYAVHDVGRALNPEAIRGQIEGGMVMAMGQALYEELVFKEGVPANPNFTDYILPSSAEAPRTMQVELVESRYQRGPFGAKGVGEMSLVPTMAAVANAIYAATGVCVREMPAKPARLLELLRSGSPQS